MKLKIRKDRYNSPYKTVTGNEGEKCNYPLQYKLDLIKKKYITKK